MISVSPVLQNNESQWNLLKIIYDNTTEFLNDSEETYKQTKILANTGNTKSALSFGVDVL